MSSDLDRPIPPSLLNCRGLPTYTPDRAASSICLLQASRPNPTSTLPRRLSCGSAAFSLVFVQPMREFEGIELLSFLEFFLSHVPTLNRSVAHQLSISLSTTFWTPPPRGWDGYTPLPPPHHRHRRQLFDLKTHDDAGCVLPERQCRPSQSPETVWGQ